MKLELEEFTIYEVAPTNWAYEDMKSRLTKEQRLDLEELAREVLHMHKFTSHECYLVAFDMFIKGYLSNYIHTEDIKNEL